MHIDCTPKIIGRLGGWRVNGVSGDDNSTGAGGVLRIVKIYDGAADDVSKHNIMITTIKQGGAGAAKRQRQTM